MITRRNFARSCFLAVLVIAPAAVRAAIDDEDSDGVADAVDVCCGTLASVQVDSAGRPLGDVDGDCDVDLLDHKMMQLNFRGPPTAAVECCFDDQCSDGDPCTTDACDVLLGECTFTALENCGGPCELAGSCSLSLECDTPISGSINPATENDYMCLCVVDGDILRVTVSEQAGSGPNFAPQWRLFDASGNPATSCGTFTALSVADCGPLPSAGNPYQLLVQDTGQNDVGNYFASYRALPAASACEDVAAACDTVHVDMVEHAADGDLLSFSVVDCETVHVAVVKTGGGANFNPSWRLIEPGGRPARACGTFSSAAQFSQDCGPLPASGNPYRIEIEDTGANDTGTYQAQLSRSAPGLCETPLECDVLAEDAIALAAEALRYGFRVAENEIVRVTVVEVGASSFVPNWRLLDGGGAPAVSCGALTASVSANCGPLPASGNPYRLEVEDQGRNDLGGFAIHLQRLTWPRSCDDIPLVCGVPYVGAINDGKLPGGPADSDLLSFTVDEGDTVTIGVIEWFPPPPPPPPPGSTPFTPQWRLIDGAGNPAPDCGTFSTSALQCGPLPAARNPYRVEIEDQGRNDTGDYQVTLTCP